MIWILYLIGAFLAIGILKDFFGMVKYFNKYRTQGIGISFTPLIGLVRYFITRDKKDGLAGFRSLIKNMKKDEDLVALNDILGTEPVLFIKSGKLLKELCSKDNECCEREIPFALPVNLGFMLKTGPEALKLRKIFSKFFVQKHLEKITPMIEKLVQQKVKLIKKEILKQTGKDSKKFGKVEMQKYWKDLFSELINYIMFGNEDYPEVKGMTIPRAVEYLISETTKDVDNHPLNLVFFNIPAKLGILPRCKELKQLSKNIDKACLDMYKKRTKLSPEQRGSNLIDIMVDHNLNCPEDEVLDENMIAGNLFLFQMAGMDTSRQVTLSSLYLLSKRPELASDLHSAVNKYLFNNGEKKFIGDLDCLDKSTYLNNFLKEALRMFAAVALGFPRVATKNFKLGKYKIYKGTGLLMMFSGPQYNSENFEDPYEFKVDRFADAQKLAKASRNGNYIPFSSGNRECIGKYLAEIFVKVGLSHFLKEFEVDRVEGFDPKREFEFTYGYKECWIKARPRGEVVNGGDSE